LLQFSSLGLADPILRALNTEGYTTPTPIQAQAIPPVMEGRDLLGCAQTGTGKTAAFALPILHRLAAQPVDKARRGPALPRVLVLSPTRELATQIGESFAAYGRHTGLTHTVIFGGVSQFHQVKALQRGVDILVATPGRLIDLMEQRLVNLSAVRVLVLDEADRMLDMGFIQPIRRIVAALPDPRSRQTLLFSATMPREIMHLADSLLRDPVKVAVTPVSSAVPLIEQSLYMVQRNSKQALLERLLDSPEVARAVVFTKTKHGADRVARRLARAGVSSDAIHGNKAQNQRTRALDAFRSGRVRVLVATDVAARGLDVDGITHVFNFDLPMEPEAYVHRIGRTGRAGATGVAVSFCDNEERGLLRDIEKLTGKAVPRRETPTDLPVIPRAEHAPRPAHAGHAPRRPQQPARGGPRHQSGHEHRAPHPKPRAAAHVETKPRHDAPASHATGGPVTPARGMRAWNRPTGRPRAAR
jgi:ATP-dependent RNA helicase RhlE